MISEPTYDTKDMESRFFINLKNFEKRKEFQNESPTLKRQLTMASSNKWPTSASFDGAKLCQNFDVGQALRYSTN